MFKVFCLTKIETASRSRFDHGQNEHVSIIIRAMQRGKTCKRVWAVSVNAVLAMKPDISLCCS